MNNKSIYEEIKRSGARKLEDENKSKYNETGMDIVLIENPNYATSVAQLGEANILKQITNHWDKEIIKSLLLKLSFDSRLELESSKEEEEIQAAK